MYHRRSQGDSKSTSSVGGSLSSMPTTINNVSSPSTTTATTTTGRVSIYSMRERVILNKMTRIMGKLAPDTETEITSRLHQEIPAIRLDGHLTYCFYITLQNLIHLHAIYILLYHSVFWLSSNNSYKQVFQTVHILEETSYEETHLISVTHDVYYETKKSININLINHYIYITLIMISSIELIIAFLWTLRKKLPYLISRNQKLKQRLSILLILMIIILYLLFLSWLLFHTFITKQLTIDFFLLILTHFILLIFLDKSNLFQESPYHISKQSNVPRKQYRNSTSSSSTSSTATAAVNRLSYRSSATMQPRKVSPIVNSTSPSLQSWSRWSSITEEKLDLHECSTFYEQARQEADNLWPIIVRRLILNIYRTISSFILFDIIPIKMIGLHVRSVDSQPLKMLIAILTLSTFVSHSAFLFPVKLQTTLHRIATHLGQWRTQSNIRTDTINEWSTEYDSYTRGSVVKLSSNKHQHYIAIQHLSNAANPQSNTHSILYRLFGDATLVLTFQFLLCFILVIFHMIWIIRGRYWEQILIGYLIIFHSSYPIFKIIRGRIILDLVEEHEFFQTSTISKKKKSS